MNFNPQKHRRRSIRLKGYDYAREGSYFITLCCQERQHFFGGIENGKMIINKAGEIVKDEWEKTSAIRQNTALHEYIIMPNHFHAIIEILFSRNSGKNSGEFKSPSQTLGAIIRGFKGATTKRIKEYYFSKANSTGELQFAPNAPNAPTELGKSGATPFPLTEIDLEKSIWQRNYYEHIIRNEKSYQNISNYIKSNPANWKNDKLYHL